MARYEQDREDLLREAVALVERIEFILPDITEPIVIGFRRQGAGSIFIGSDLVLQFNSSLELRRGFFEGRLLKAEEGRLVALERRRLAHETQLLRKELSAIESSRFLQLAADQQTQLLQAFKTSQLQIVGQVTVGDSLVARITDWLQQLPIPVVIATRPNVA